MPTPLKYTGRLLFITYKSLWGDPIPSLQYIIQQKPKNYGYWQFQIPTFMFRTQHKLIILYAFNDPKAWMRPQQQRIYQSCLHVVLKVEFSCSYFFVLFFKKNIFWFGLYEFILVWLWWSQFYLIMLNSVPGTNQYWAMNKYRFVVQGNNESLNGFLTHAQQLPFTFNESNAQNTEPCHPSNFIIKFLFFFPNKKNL